MRSNDIPFMGFRKAQGPDGRVVWSRVELPRPGEEAVGQLCRLSRKEVERRPTEEKRLWLYNQILERYKDAEKGRTELLVRRGHFFHDSFEQLHSAAGADLCHEFRVRIGDEPGTDAGGLVREWFSLLVEEMLDPALGLFCKVPGPQVSYGLQSPDSSAAGSDQLERLAFCGQVLAKAIFDRVPVKGFLHVSLLKRLLGQHPVLSDLRSYDAELWRSLVYLRDNRLSANELGATFTVTEKNPTTGGTQVVELRPAGRTQLVDDSNKEEFCQLLADYYLQQRSAVQTNALVAGFHSLIPLEIISVLDVDELELFLCGETNIDLTDWQTYTTYKGDYHQQHTVIQWFWTVMARLNEAERRRFLQFCTGSTRVPAEGFKGLMSNSGKVCTFCIEPRDYAGAATAFIVAHTCFNRIELPEFPSLELMELNIRSMLHNDQVTAFSFE